MKKRSRQRISVFPADIIPEENDVLQDEKSMLEEEIIKIIDKALKERLVELAIDDIRLIARELMPDLDMIIANKVKEHFYQIGNFLVEKFGDDMGE